MLLNLVFMTCCVTIILSSPIVHQISRYSCNDDFTVDDEGSTFMYSGADLNFPCKLEMQPRDILNDICVAAINVDSTCTVRMEYHDYIVTRAADEEVDCYSSRPTDEHCTSSSSLYVVLEKMSTKLLGSDSLQIQPSVNIQFKVYTKNNDLVDRVEKAVYVTIGVIVGVIVIVAIASVVVIVICCNRRSRRAPGMVYNQAQSQNTVTTQVQYPAQPQQYPPGNQPTAYGQPMGAAVPMTGYPPAPSAGGFVAGYQGPPAYNEQEKQPSAPPMVQPPPYPGN